MRARQAEIFLDGGLSDLGSEFHRFPVNSFPRNPHLGFGAPQAVLLSHLLDLGGGFVC
jgi:hypothetical protein